MTDKKLIESLLVSNSKRIRNVENSKSDVSFKFERIIFDQNLTEYVKYKRFKVFYKHNVIYILIY